MNIGILGSGVVARTLAQGFARHGHSVMLGSRNPAQLADFLAEHPGLRAGSFADAADFAELAVLAVKGSAAMAALQIAGPDRLAGKTVIDTSNPIADAPPVNGVLPFFTGPNDSLMEQLQREFPAINLVKAFSSVGNARMVNPTFAEGQPSMFICGDDAHAKAQVGAILVQFGWLTEDMGAVTAARAIEPLCMLWCIKGFNKNSWGHAFRLLNQ